MKIKIIKASKPEYEGKILDLKEISEMVFKDEAQNIEIIDGYGELKILEVYSLETNQTRFYDCNAFVKEPETIVFIDEIEYLE